jgi:hypothetical protein
MGMVKIRLAFDEWKEGRIAPASFVLPLPAKEDR